ncbi:MAG: hypothetical protein LBU28_04185, partial [Spirochaetaceae bacterium]|nr:hypothetical protein [Spirochaetaceae bacterium]
GMTRGQQPTIAHSPLYLLIVLYNAKQSYVNTFLTFFFIFLLKNSKFFPSPPSALIMLNTH